MLHCPAAITSSHFGGSARQDFPGKLHPASCGMIGSYWVVQARQHWSWAPSMATAAQQFIQAEPASRVGLIPELGGSGLGWLAPLLSAATSASHRSAPGSSTNCSRHRQAHHFALRFTAPPQSFHRTSAATRGRVSQASSTPASCGIIGSHWVAQARQHWPGER